MVSVNEPSVSDSDSVDVPDWDVPVSIMVVDDRKPNRTVLLKLAGQLSRNAKVAAFDDAHEALDAALADPPDLIITDYKMPGLSGGAFVKKLRADHRTRDVPVIVVTAYEDKQFRYDALQAGASDFLLSPVDKFEFLQRGRNLLTMRRQHQQLARQAAAREKRLANRNRLRERELHLSEEKFQLVVNALPAFITAIDRSGRLSFVNAQFARAFGLEDPNGVAGSDLREVVPAEIAERHNSADADVIESGASVSFEELVIGHDGRSRTLLTSKAPLYANDSQIAYVITISVDITALKEAENELEAAKRQAQDANRAKTEFLANISHELRTPLNAIMGFADVGRQELLGPIGSPRYREYQEDIYSSGAQLLALIDDLLDFSRLELGRLRVCPEPFDLGQAVQSSVKTFEGHAASRNITLTVTVDPELPTIWTDPGRFRQILSNLVSNALKYSYAGGMVTVSLGRHGPTGIELCVADQGPGMTTAELQTALSRFGRLGNANSQDQPGVGLGLPISRDLADLLRGALTVHSMPGQGTRIIVHLSDLHTDAGGAMQVARDEPAEDRGRG
jgi:PAS domain S-box-containing protein